MIEVAVVDLRGEIDERRQHPTRGRALEVACGDGHGTGAKLSPRQRGLVTIGVADALAAGEALAMKPLQRRLDRADRDSPSRPDVAMHVLHVDLAMVPHVLEHRGLELTQQGQGRYLRRGGRPRGASQGRAHPETIALETPIVTRCCADAASSGIGAGTPGLIGPSRSTGGAGYNCIF